MKLLGRIVSSPLVVAGVAVLIAMLGLLRQRPIYVIESMDAAEYQALVQYQRELSDQVAELSARMAEMEASDGPILRSPAVTPTPARSVPVEEINTNLAELKSGIDALEKQAAEILAQGGRRPAMQDERAALAREALEEYKNQVLDTKLDPAARVAALKILRSYPKVDLRDASVAASVADLIASSDVPAIRADAARHIKGAQDPRLAAVLQQVLGADASSQVREEAAESLAPMRDDVGVREALRMAMKEDKDWRVRQAAREALGE